MALKEICDDCGEPSEELAQTHYGDDVCPQCHEEYYVCIQCDDSFYESDFGSEDLCRNCEESNLEDDDDEEDV